MVDRSSAQTRPSPGTVAPTDGIASDPSPGAWHWLRITVHWSLVVYIILMVWYKTYPVANVFATFAGIGAIFLHFAERDDRGSRRRERLLVFGVAAFVAMQILAIVLHLDQAEVRGGITFDRTYIPGVLFALALALTATTAPSGVRYLRLLLIASAAWYAGEILSLPFRSAFSFDSVHPGYRLKGLRGNAASLGSELSILTALYLSGFFVAKDRRSAIAALVCCVCVCVLMILTKTRTALLAAILISVPLSVIFNSSRWRGRRKAALALWYLVGVPLLTTTWWFANPDRISLETLRYRYGMWESSVRMTEQATMLDRFAGHGAFRETFPSLLEYYGVAPRFWEFSQTPYHAHNTMLQLLLEVGVVGVLVFTCLLVLALAGLYRAGARNKSDWGRLARWIAPALLSLGLIAQADCCLWWVPGRMFWLLTALAWACWLHSPDPTDEPRRPLPNCSQ